VPAVEGTGRASRPVGGKDLVAAATHHSTELLVHPPVGVADLEVAVDELEALTEAVHEALVEFLEGRGLAPRPIQNHDDDGEGGEKVKEHEAHVDRHVGGRSRFGIEERRHDPVHAPEGQGGGEEATAPIPRLGRSRPELEAGEDQGRAGGDPGDAPHGEPGIGDVPEARRDQRARSPQEEVAPADAIAGAKREAGGQHEEGGPEEHRVDQRARDVLAGDERLREMKPLRQTHETPSHHQVAEESHPV